MYQSGGIEFSSSSSSNRRDGSASTNVLDNPFRSAPSRVENSTKTAAEGMIPQSQLAPSRIKITYSNLRSTEHKDKDIINVFGVLVTFSAGPKSCNSKASHKFSCTYSLIDLTDPNPQFPMVLTVFGNASKDFPQHIQTGDIMRFINVKVDHFNNFQKLIGSSDKNGGLKILSFHRKVNYLTGFQNDHNDGGSNTGLLSSEWDIQSSTSTYPLDATDSETVKNLNSWSEQIFIRTSLGEQGNLTMTLKNIVSLPTERKDQRCDLVCMVVAVMVPVVNITSNNNNVSTGKETTVLLWDGTTTGELNLAHPTSQHDMHISLQAAGLFAEETINCSNREEFLNLKERINVNPPRADINTLHGSPFAVSSQPSDHAISAELMKLKPGMWIRLRNLHVDQPVVGTVFESFYKDSNKRKHDRIGMNESNSVIDSVPSLCPINCSVVGYVHSDTHINHLLPYYRDAGVVAVNYQARITEMIHAEQHQQQQQQQQHQQQQQQQQQQQRPKESAQRLLSLSGVPIDTLNFCLNKPPPQRLCTSVRILSYWPTDVSRFVWEKPCISSSGSSSSSSSSTKLSFKFSVTIADNENEADVFVLDQDAEYFLGGITAEVFNNDARIRDRVEERLKWLCGEVSNGDRNKNKNKPTAMEFQLTSYLCNIDQKSGKKGLRLSVRNTCIM